MDCAKYLELLSDYCDGALDDETRALVQTHLGECLPCDGILHDLFKAPLLEVRRSLQLGHQRLGDPDTAA